MIGLILAGGFARRMKELGENIPKALLPVENKPVIEFIIKKMENINDIEKETKWSTKGDLSRLF